MKNKILYYYNIYISTLNTDHENYSFIYNNNNYYLKFFDRPLEDLNYLYELNQDMLHNGFIVHKIIPTINQNLVIFIDDKPYVLLQIAKFINRKIVINDILSYNYIPNSKLINNFHKPNWSKLWENKIDYIEYQFSQMNKKYSLLNESINYYLGMWENAISYFNNRVNANSKVLVCHHRININDTLNNFYDPLNFVIDYKERDIGEYLKSYIITKKVIPTINYLSNYNPYLLISRLLFPSYYFDLYEKIISGTIKEREIIDITDLSTFYENFLKDVFSYYNGTIPISWLIKKES